MGRSFLKFECLSPAVTLCVFILDEWWAEVLQFKDDSEGPVFEKLSMAILFIPLEFLPETETSWLISLHKNIIKYFPNLQVKYFRISFCWRTLTWGVNCGLTLPTRLWGSPTYLRQLILIIFFYFILFLFLSFNQRKMPEKPFT